MELAIWLLSGALALSLLMLLLLILAFRWIAKNLTQTIDRERQRNQETLESLNLHQKDLQEPLISLLSKQSTLLSVKDPISFQQVQLMDSASTPETSKPVDNSDNGELQQWIDNNDQLTDMEKELYRELDASN